jgi:signal transduction histidine kinase
MSVHELGSWSFGIRIKLKPQKMDTRTIELNFKKRRSHQSVNLFKFLFPHKEVQKEPDHFASALAHEVRNPLATINLAVQILKSPAKVLDHKLYLDIIMKASGQINDLITDLLKSWQPATMEPEQYSIHQLLDEALAMTEDRLLLKNITVRKDYSTLDCKILVNKRKIKIALVNIIINAIEAMHSERGKLKLITRSINGKCIIEIEDNGIGISTENLKNLFTPYFTHKAGGMGLGLSTTIDILNANHATVDVQSEEGKGTRFILFFEGIQKSGE